MCLGRCPLEAQYLANKLTKGFIGTNQIESNSRLCMASAGSGYKLSLGADGPPGSYQDFDQADVFFVIGANMADCHPILFLRMMDRVKAGAKLIVVDPRRTATADKADLFLQISPGTDLALLNGLLHLIVENGHTDDEFIAEFTEGWEVMPSFLEQFTPDKVSEITGIPAEDIRTAARWIGEAANWMSCWTMGLNQSTHGTWNTNAICNLHLATGAICKPGSGPFSLTGQPNAMGGREMGYMGPGLPGQRSVTSADDRDFVEDQWGIPRGSLRTDVGDRHDRHVLPHGRRTDQGVLDHLHQSRCHRGQSEDGAGRPGKRRAGDHPGRLLRDRDQRVRRRDAAGRPVDGVRRGDDQFRAQPDPVPAGRRGRRVRRCRTGRSSPGSLARWAFRSRSATTSAEEVFDEIKRFWNPATGYDLRGASYERLRQTPLQWPCPPDSTDDRNPIRYLQRRCQPDPVGPRGRQRAPAGVPDRNRSGGVLRPPAPAAGGNARRRLTRSCSTPDACRTNGTR